MRRRKEDAEQTLHAIMDAAEEMFCTQGVAAATLEKIARQAGVTRGAVYWYFKDKTDLLRALRERSLTPQHILIRTAAEQGHDDPLGLLQDAAEAMLTAFEQDLQQQRMFMILQSRMPDAEGTAWLNEVNAEMYGALTALFRQAAEKGMLAKPFSPEEAATLLMASVSGLLNEWLRSGQRFSLVDLGTRYLAQQMVSFRLGPDLTHPALAQGADGGG